MPYSLAYADEMVRSHGLLNEAADAVAGSDPQFARYLRNRARDLLSDDYESGDAAWLKGRFKNLNAQIGAYETYDDELLGTRAFYGLSLLATRTRESAELREAMKGIQELENSLPYERRRRVMEDIPVGVYDVVADFGQTRGGNTATNLPNEAYLVERYGSIILLRANIMRNPDLFRGSGDIYGAAVVPGQAGHLTADGNFYRTLWHEVGHYLGPDVTARAQTLDSIGADANLLEEMKADLVSLFVAKELRRRGYYSEAQLRSLYASGILRTLQNNKPRREQPYNMMQLMQWNWFLDRKVLSFDPATAKLTVDYDRYHDAVRDLLKQVIAIQEAGDAAAAAAFIDRWGRWDDGSPRPGRRQHPRPAALPLQAVRIWGAGGRAAVRPVLLVLALAASGCAHRQPAVPCAEANLPFVAQAMPAILALTDPPPATLEAGFVLCSPHHDRLLAASAALGAKGYSSYIGAADRDKCLRIVRTHEASVRGPGAGGDDDVPDRGRPPDRLSPLADGGGGEGRQARRRAAVDRRSARLRSRIPSPYELGDEEVLRRATSVQPPNDLVGGLLDAQRRRVDPYLRRLRRLVGGADAGEIGDPAVAGLGVEALGVALLGDRERHVDMDLDELAFAEHLAHHPPLGPERADEGGQHDQPGVEHQPRRLPDPADILGPVGVGEAEVAVEAEADIVAVEQEGVPPGGVKLLLDEIGDGRLAGAGKAGEPEQPRPSAPSSPPAPRGSRRASGDGGSASGASAWRMRPAPTVSLVTRSMRMKPPRSRLSS